MGCFDPDIEVWVYNDERWPPQTLAQVYAWMAEEQLPSVFWRDGVMPSLNAFIRWYSDPSRVLFLPVLCEDISQVSFEHIMGMAWLDEVEPHRASAHFWIRKQFRTKSAWQKQLPLRMGRAVLQTIFLGAPTLQVLSCRMNTQNYWGVGFMKRLGVHFVGEMPRWYRHGEQYHDAVIGYILREDILSEQVLPIPSNGSEQENYHA